MILVPGMINFVQKSSKPGTDIRSKICMGGMGPERWHLQRDSVELCAFAKGLVKHQRQQEWNNLPRYLHETDLVSTQCSLHTPHTPHTLALSLSLSLSTPSVSASPLVLLALALSAFSPSLSHRHPVSPSLPHALSFASRPLLTMGALMYSLVGAAVDIG